MWVTWIEVDTLCPIFHCTVASLYLKALCNIFLHCNSSKLGHIYI